MKRIILFALSIIILGTAIPTRCSRPDPSEELLRKSTEEILEYLLEITPVGSRIQDVLALINSNEDWTLRYVNNSYGFAMRNGRPSEPSSADIADGNVVGTQSVRVLIGSYWSSPIAIYITHVAVFWAFDGNSNLVDIQVRK